MDREILFRAKEKDNGIWFEGDLVRDIDNFGERRTIIHQILGKGKSRHILANPETVCQFTGLHDSTKWEQLSETEKKKFLSGWNHEANRRSAKEDWRGRKIFEGDIFKYKDSFGIIEYRKDSFKLKWIVNKEFANDILRAWREYIEVIGNIFDNPELLT